MSLLPKIDQNSSSLLSSTVNNVFLIAQVSEQSIFNPPADYKGPIPKQQLGFNDYWPSSIQRYGTLRGSSISYDKGIIQDQDRYRIGLLARRQKNLYSTLVDIYFSNQPNNSGVSNSNSSNQQMGNDKYARMDLEKNLDQYFTGDKASRAEKDLYSAFKRNEASSNDNLIDKLRIGAAIPGSARTKVRNEVDQFLRDNQKYMDYAPK